MCLHLLLEDWLLTRTRLADTEQRMAGVVEELGLTSLGTSITGLSVVGAARSWPRSATCAGLLLPARW